MEKLLSVLTDIRPDVDFEKEDNLVNGGILDSFDVITIVGELSINFDVNIDVKDIVPENLNSAKAMWELVVRSKK